MGGGLRFSAALLIFIAVFALPAASSRVLLADEEVSPSPTPTPPPVTAEKPHTATPRSKSAPLGPAGKPSGAAKENSLKGSDNTTQSGEPASGKGTGGKEDGEEGPSPKSAKDDEVKEVCDVTLNNCHDKGKLVACLKKNDNVLNESDILLQNKGESVVTVKIKGKHGLSFNDCTVPGRSSMKISIPIADWNGTEITLNAGSGDCILHLPPQVSDRNLFPQFPTPKPVHGVYLLAFTVIIVGGIWACCKFRNKERRRDSGAPYQQLEMGIQPQSGSAIEESGSANGWDENWDDDWDEEEAAAKLPDKHHAASVSSNGVPSKAPNKDGWDDDWDD